MIRFIILYKIVFHNDKLSDLKLIINAENLSQQVAILFDNGYIIDSINHITEEGE